MTSAEEREVITLYRRVFSSPDGQRVLAHMSTELNTFNTIVDDRERILQNYGKHLLHRCGIDFTHMESLMAMLFRLPTTL